MTVKKRAVTFIEVLVVLSILIILIVIAIGVFNPTTQVNKGKDARRKADLKRISVAFEEYYNDNGCYPTQALIDRLRCFSSDFGPWLVPWPCDPDSGNYAMFIEDTDCPRQYQIYTKLKNTKDEQAINCDYGVSSENIDWKDFPPFYVTGCGQTLVGGGVEEDLGANPTPVECCDPGACHTRPGGAACNNVTSCSGENCYYDRGLCPWNNCDIRCRAESCGL